MAFALAVNNLVEALKKPGCPICRLFQQVSEKALESFLWENVNEPDVRQGILNSYGFCPAHTKVMVSREIYTSSLPLGTNIIYEHLGRVVANELKSLRPGSPGQVANQVGGAARGWLSKIGLGKAGGPLQPRGICPACESGNNGALNSLHVLCDELRKDGDVRALYLASDGICLPHLRTAIDLHTAHFPESISLLIDNTVERLEGQSKAMKEFIRKNNWTYRDEKLTEAEDTAWRKTLTFFTGFSSDTFGFKMDR